MKDGKYGFIYITTNLINKKKYIGQKIYNSGWKTYLGSGTILKKAIKKYGRENFQREIIEECDNQDELNQREIYWISYYNAIENEQFYNMNDGGGVCPVHHGKNHPLAKRVICLNTLELFDCIEYAVDKYGCDRSSIRGCCDGSLHRTRNSDNKWLTWMFYNDYQKSSPGEIQNRLKMCNEGNYGKNNVFYGKIHTEESKEKIRKARLKSPSRTNKKVICLTTNEIFESLKQAGEYYNISSIGDCCRGRNSHAGKLNGQKLVWMYYDEYLKDTENIIDKYPVICKNNNGSSYKN